MPNHKLINLFVWLLDKKVSLNRQHCNATTVGQLQRKILRSYAIKNSGANLCLIVQFYMFLTWPNPKNTNNGSFVKYLRSSWYELNRWLANSTRLNFLLYPSRSPSRFWTLSWNVVMSLEFFKTELCMFLKASTLASSLARVSRAV